MRLAFTFAFLLLCMGLRLSSATNPSSSPTPVCYNSWFRTLGETNFYRWVCGCQFNGRRRALGVVSHLAPIGKRNSFARYLRFLRCHDQVRRRYRLSSLCITDIRKWRRIATREIRRCSNLSPSKDDLREKGSLLKRFNRQNCVSTFITRVDGSNRQGVWICRCNQAQFRVQPPESPPDIVVGQARFQTVGSPGGSEKELAFLSKCIGNVKKQGDDVCGSSFNDFNILGRHLLETCCKRARTKFPKSKFACKAIVRDDLSGLKIAV